MDATAIVYTVDAQHCPAIALRIMRLSTGRLKRLMLVVRPDGDNVAISAYEQDEGSTFVGGTPLKVNA